MLDFMGFIGALAIGYIIWMLWAILYGLCANLPDMCDEQKVKQQKVNDPNDPWQEKQQ